MTTAKRSQQLTFGKPSVNSVLEISDVNLDYDLQPNFVQIEARALSLNPIDYKLITGELNLSKKPLPRGYGSDVSGVVTAVGSSVTRIKVGDEVYSDAIGFSPFGSVCQVPESKVSVKPASLSFNEAAAIPLAGLTALQALRDKAAMKQGAKVVIFGGSGGVGSFAIQIAKALGASEVVTTSTNEDLCKSLGADRVINYRNEVASEVLKAKDYDVVFDTVGGYGHYEQGKKLLKSSGTYVSIVGDGVSIPKMVPRLLWRKFKSNFGSAGYQIFFTNSNSADLDVLSKFVDEGKLKATIDSVFQFNDEGVREMFSKQMSGRTKGKNIMEVKK
ncbi:hypothetical protein TL16_g03753 [Triparma laevis f. inornata]|uniref:Enoyl reductase (ER) domain-containing protein n=2 Tax=Triparma laevis TaxID=1534972 RepID=A0A9W7CLZ7_9STRA|nr:hypothetical protein TL16_g03753 [Triparma laevis f. inornata]GMI08278.1 hypothetical protein TrLO_g6467 [Triparma laevis f. longispina]